jgi:inner membrane protein YidH
MPDETTTSDDVLIRTFLAGERTFLAWLRTAIVMIAAGIAAAALTETDGVERIVATALGTFAVLGGCFVVLWAYQDYQKNMEQVRRGEFRPSTRLPLAATVVTGMVGILAVVFAIVEWTAT